MSTDGLNAPCPNCEAAVYFGKDPRSEYAKTVPVRRAFWFTDCEDCGLTLQVIDLDPPKVTYAEEEDDDDSDDDDDF